MLRFRFSLFGLVWVVVVAAFGFAALRHPSEVWETATLSAVLCALFVAIIGMVGSRRDSRAFWIGFALFGWAYLWLAFGEFRRYSQRLLTDHVLSFFWRELEQSGVFRVPSGTSYVHRPNQDQFIQIGHLILVSLFALCGGVLCRYFYIRREQSSRYRHNDTATGR